MPDLRNISIIFVSILLEAFPFILLGAIVSSVIQIFVSKEWIEKVLPKRKWVGLFVAAFVGFVFPVCECTIIPVTRRLIKKGVPPGMAMTFMLCVPIVNPVVLLSTYVAFNGDFKIMIARAIFGMVGAIAIGFCIGQEAYATEDVLREGESATHKRALPIRKPSSRTSSKRAFGVVGARKAPIHKQSKLKSVFDHALHEFRDITKYLVFGAVLTALFHTYVDRKTIASFSQKPYLMVGAMMLLAFVLSVCSEVDAFIGKSFVASAGMGPVMAFLVFGPMLDIKNVAMLFGNFKAKFAAKAIVYIVLINFLLGLIATILWL
jgi:hypothetical protein